MPADACTDRSAREKRSSPVRLWRAHPPRAALVVSTLMMLCVVPQARAELVWVEAAEKPYLTWAWEWPSFENRSRIATPGAASSIVVTGTIVNLGSESVSLIKIQYFQSGPSIIGLELPGMGLVEAIDGAFFQANLDPGDTFRIGIVFDVQDVCASGSARIGICPGFSCVFNYFKITLDMSWIQLSLVAPAAVGSANVFEVQNNVYYDAAISIRGISRSLLVSLNRTDDPALHIVALGGSCSFAAGSTADWIGVGSGVCTVQCPVTLQVACTHFSNIQQSIMRFGVSLSPSQELFGSISQVFLLVCHSSPTPTPTPTATGTATLTPTPTIVPVQSIFPTVSPTSTPSPFLDELSNSSMPSPTPTLPSPTLQPPFPSPPPTLQVWSSTSLPTPSPAHMPTLLPSAYPSPAVSMSAVPSPQPGLAISPTPLTSPAYPSPSPFIQDAEETLSPFPTVPAQPLSLCQRCIDVRGDGWLVQSMLVIRLGLMDLKAVPFALLKQQLAQAILPAWERDTDRLQITDLSATDLDSTLRRAMLTMSLSTITIEVRPLDGIDPAIAIQERLFALTPEKLHLPVILPVDFSLIFRPSQGASPQSSNGPGLQWWLWLIVICFVVVMLAIAGFCFKRWSAHKQPRPRKPPRKPCDRALSISSKSSEDSGLWLEIDMACRACAEEDPCRCLEPNPLFAMSRVK